MLELVTFISFENKRSFLVDRRIAGRFWLDLIVAAGGFQADKR
jgi:hypothetical protein